MAAVVDVDSHVYEPPAVWDSYVPAEYRGVARAAFYHEVDKEGNRLTVLNGGVGRELNRSRLVRQAIWRPGMTPEQIGQLDPDVFQPLNPGAFDPSARLADMDAMGVDVAVVFPTLFTEYLPLVENPDAAAVLARAYNDWVWDFCAQGAGRLHPVALVPMHAPLLAQRELDRVAEKGFTSVMIRPAFHYAPQIEAHDPQAMLRQAMKRMLSAASGGADLGSRTFVEDVPYRPVWRHIDELGLVACVHPSLGITGPDAVSSGGFAERVAQRLGATHTVAEPIAYMQDADLFMTAAFFHGLLEDHPNLRLAICHSGATWIPLALEKCETYLWLSPQFGMAEVCLEPEEVFERHPIVVSFDGWEKPVARMPDRIGKKAAWGSRYPHHDTSTPDEARGMLTDAGVDQATVDALLGGHAAELFGLRVPTTA
ncbi:MAG TPA: amidohydrolase family protein [Acidimicrobiales bacterium]|nr:amidohydrolase family protein [Acidimicrobiales bacterium]